MPILLRTKPCPIRARPKFRAENWWVLRPGFDEVCKKSAAARGTNWGNVRNAFKKEVRVWGAQSKMPCTMLKEIESGMAVLQAGKPDEIDPNQEQLLQREHDQCLQMREYYWHQHSRVSWAMFGDKNYKFFHAAAITRKRRNSVCTLKLEEDKWISDEKEIMRAFITHFKGIYTASPRPSVYESVPPQILAIIPVIPEAIRPLLDELPLELEIKHALFSLGPYKAVGPDGFHAKLIQDQWDAFGAAFIEEVSNFFLTGYMPSHVARSNLVLVPKTNDACSVTQFRPISVCNTTYKMISKILANHIRPFIAGCVSNAQGAFVPGREILHNVILLRVVLQSFKQKGYKNKKFCLKVDLSKAFDRIDWG